MTTPTLKEQKLLVQTVIANYVAAVNKDFGRCITPEIESLMAKSLAKFVERAVDKFAKGQREHGGDIRDRDLGFELYQEQLDSFWYNEAEDWKATKILREKV